MVEIRYGDQYEVTDLAGHTVSEAREHFKSEFGIPDKAKAKLNGGKVKSSAELETVLNDDDRLTFAVSRSRGVYLVGALLLALAATGGVFAYGFINASTTNISVGTPGSNFADVTENTSGTGDLTWSTYGHFKGSIVADYTANGTPIFNIDTTGGGGYTGDLVVTVTLGNADALAEVYKVLALKLDMSTPDGNNMDINGDGTPTTADWVMLTLNNGEVSMFPGGTANVTNVRVKSGFYITHARPNAGWGGTASASPELFCEVAQR